jgi:hypothetical protein
VILGLSFITRTSSHNRVGHLWATRRNRMEKLLTVCSLFLFSVICGFSQVDDAYRTMREDYINLASVYGFRKVDGSNYNVLAIADTEKRIVAGWKPGADAKLPSMDFELIIGKVFQVLDNGALIKRYDATDVLMKGDHKLVFVKSVPNAYSLVDGDTIAVYAMAASRFSYTSTMGARSTVQGFNFCTPLSKEEAAPLEKSYKEQLQREKDELSAKQSAIQKSKINATNKAKSDADAKTLKWNQEQAAQGDAYGLLRMGERYAKGDGVDKDMAKAKAFLMRASAAGSKDADDELKRLGSDK